jgi:segregation and condensation protein A
MTTTRPYEVHLEIFEGPLDLLLFLIKKNDLDIADIPIAQITGEYLGYIDLMRELNLEVAGEFLVVASTLMQIKARALLPPAPGDEESGPDPREELVQKLQEYQKFKSAAAFLNLRAEEFKDVHFRGAPRFKAEEKTLQVSMLDLMSALREILERVPETRGIEAEEFPIEEKMRKILFLLESNPRLPLSEVFADERRRPGVIACFLGLLELIKLQSVMARQDEPFAPIYIIRKEKEASSAEGEAIFSRRPAAAEEAPAEEVPAEAPADEVPVAEVPAAETVAVEVPTAESAVMEAPAAEAAAMEAPAAAEITTTDAATTEPSTTEKAPKLDQEAA